MSQPLVRTPIAIGDEPKKAALIYLPRNHTVLLGVLNRTYDCWGLPGGKVDAGESVLDAGIRELREETGVQLLRALPIYKSPTFSDSGHMCYVLQALEWAGQPSAVETDTAVGWMTRGRFALDRQTGPWFRDFFAFLANPYGGGGT